MICHHNFGVSEHSDPLDGVLLGTVSSLKHPPRVPTEHEPERSSAPVKGINRLNPSLGVPRAEGYIEG